jgi:hypothetical protein
MAKRFKDMDILRENGDGTVEYHLKTKHWLMENDDEPGTKYSAKIGSNALNSTYCTMRRVFYTT